MDKDGKDLRLQPLSVAHRARNFAEVFAPALPLRVTLCLQVLALDVRDNALEPGGIAHLAPVAILPLHPDLEVVTPEDRVLHVVTELSPWSGQGEVQVAREALEELLVILKQSLALGRPRQNNPFRDAEVRVAKEKILIDRHTGTEPGALRARTERCIERKGPRLDLSELHRVIVRARQLLGVALPGLFALLIDKVDVDQTIGELEGCLQRVGQTAEDFRSGDQPVDDNRDVVLDLLLQRWRFIQLDLGAVDDGPGVPAGRKLLEEIDKFALLLRDHGTDDLVPGAGLEFHQLVGDLLHRLGLDDLTTHCAVWDSDTSPEQAHVVVDLGDGANG